MEPQKSYDKYIDYDFFGTNHIKKTQALKKPNDLNNVGSPKTFSDTITESKKQKNFPKNSPKTQKLKMPTKDRPFNVKIFRLNNNNWEDLNFFGLLYCDLKSALLDNKHSNKKILENFFIVDPQNVRSNAMSDAIIENKNIDKIRNPNKEHLKKSINFFGASKTIKENPKFGDFLMLQIFNKSNKKLALSHLVSNTIKYCRDGDSIITWAENGEEIALSFAEKEECDLVFELLLSENKSTRFNIGTFNDEELVSVIKKQKKMENKSKKMKIDGKTDSENDRKIENIIEKIETVTDDNLIKPSFGNLGSILVALSGDALSNCLGCCFKISHFNNKNNRKN
ncbi:hypothetical protein MHBO_003132 [Bonamia ostreae]|uniref:Uncharacterized protein n=1 Tax=Bonamia ostreae TaxID=126728 RepID=A0ABV2APJ9_9EUKA